MSEERSPGLEPPVRSSWILELRKSKFKYLFVIFGANLFFLPLLFAQQVCLPLFVLPVAIVLFFWILRIDSFWHHLAIGAAAMVVAAIFAAAVYAPTLANLEGEEVRSVDYKLHDGGVEPFRGGVTTIHNYTVTVDHSEGANISAFVYIFENSVNYWLPSFKERNETMTLLPEESTETSSTFYYETTVGGTINSYIFVVKDGEFWYSAGDVFGERAYPIYGPISDNGLAIYAHVLLLWLTYVYAYSFLFFLVLTLFLRFMIKSREARKKLIEKYRETKMEQEEPTAVGAERAKRFPSVSVGAPGEDVFVCSECGADVPATAKFCPNCGESFDEET